MSFLESAAADFRFGLRMLEKSRAATLASIACLALAIGACTAAFSLLDALVFRPLPLPDSGRLIALARVMPSFMNPGNVARESDSFSYPQYELLRERARGSADLFALSLSAGFQPAQFDDSGGAGENVRAESISGDGFHLLGVRPAFGRLIQPDDDSIAGDRPVAVLSHAFWKRRFGGSPAAIGRWVAVGGGRYQIVGVAAQGFSGLAPGYLTDIWLPLAPAAGARALADADRGLVQVWGLLRPGARREALEPVLQPALTNFVRERMQVNPPRNWSAAQIRQFAEAPLRAHDASRGRDSLFRLQFRTPLRILALICALLLFVACSNVANVLIARASARQQEMAVRVALGASRGRLMQQMLVESAQIAACAFLVALSLASFLAPALAARVGTTEFPAWIAAGMDARTAGFALAVSLTTAALCGAVPAMQASQAAPRAGFASARPIGPLRWMLAAQVGFCVAVLFLCGLLLVSFRKLIAVDLGFARDNIALFELAPRVPGGTGQYSGAAVLDAVRRLPGVRAASLSQQRPMGGDMVWILMPFVRFPGHAVETARPREVPVSAGFFQALAIPWVSGRDFLPHEIANRSDAVIVNQAFVDRFLAGRDPVGQQFERLADEPAPVRQRIVGVVANTRWNNLREPDQPTIYTPLRGAAGATLNVRTVSAPGPLIPSLRKEIEAAAPGLSARNSILLSTQIDNLLVRERLLAVLAGFFSAVALLVVGVGLYGVAHFAAVRRTREIGIRMALGARRASVVGLLAKQTSAPLMAGVAAGTAGGAALARYLTAQLFGLRPTDFWSLAAPLALILIAAAAAVLPPAVRAAGADPVAALRQE